MGGEESSSSAIINSKLGQSEKKTRDERDEIFLKGNRETQTGRNALHLMWAGLHLKCNECLCTK